MKRYCRMTWIFLMGLSVLGLCACPPVKTTCDKHSECIDGYLCDLTKHKCIECSDCTGCQNKEDCNDSNVCTEDICPASGICEHQQIENCPCQSNGACDDGLYCNGEDTCDANVECSLHANAPCSDQVCDEEDDVCRLKINWQLVAAGADHACALSMEGKAYCWGWNKFGQLGNGNMLGSSIPVEVDTSSMVGEKTFVQLTAAGEHTCGVAVDGKAYCWGSDSSGQLGNGDAQASSLVPMAVDTSTMTGATTFLQLSAGWYHTCGIATDNGLYCWGTDIYGRLGNGDGVGDSQSPQTVDTTLMDGDKSFAQVTAGYWHTCGISTDAKAYCWGYNIDGQVGDNSDTTQLQSPVAVDTSTLSGTTSFEFISAGHGHTCGISGDGKAYCWGWDGYGALGNGSDVGSTKNPSPVDTSLLPSGQTWLRISASQFATCGVTDDGQGYCWGDNSDGQLGVGIEQPSYDNPALVDTSSITGSVLFENLSVGYNHACGITSDGDIYCWGSDYRDQLGDGGELNLAFIPREVDVSQVQGAGTFVELGAGSSRTCGITSEQKAYCWGSGSSGELGTGAYQGSQIPLAVDISGTNFDLIDSGANHTCGITKDYKTYCWGYDGSGQLGNGGAGDSNSPILLDISTIEITTGKNHTCGINPDDNMAYCWGAGSDGQLGNGGVDDQQSPVQVPTLTFRQLSAGGIHTCGITTDGLAYCWGDNSAGQLGSGDGTSERLTPFAVDTSTVEGAKTFLQLSSGEFHTCGINQDNVAYCWGRDAHGQLGNGENHSNQSLPMKVDTSTITGATGFQLLAAGNLHTCGIAMDGKAYCWGWDGDDQLGEGAGPDKSQSPVAVDVSGLSDSKLFVRLSAGFDHTCGLTTLGKVYCWGDDHDGQLGNGEEIEPFPVPIKTQIVQ